MGQSEVVIVIHKRRRLGKLVNIKSERRKVNQKHLIMEFLNNSYQLSFGQRKKFLQLPKGVDGGCIAINRGKDDLPTGQSATVSSPLIRAPGICQI